MPEMMAMPEFMADMRYAFIEGVCAECVVKAQESREALRSVRIDKVLTDKYAAIPVFVGIMALIFWLTFSVIGKWLSELLSMGIDWLTGVVDAALTAYGLNPVVHSLLINGVFAGVGSVLSFLPIIVMLFFFLSILEDTGYMPMSMPATLLAEDVSEAVEKLPSFFSAH